MYCQIACLKGKMKFQSFIFLILSLGTFCLMLSNLQVKIVYIVIICSAFMIVGVQQFFHSFTPHSILMYNVVNPLLINFFIYKYNFYVKGFCSICHII